MFPLPGHMIEIFFDMLKRPWIKFKEILPSPSEAVHDLRSLQHSQVLRDGLPSERGALSQLGNGILLPIRKPREQQESRLITKSREDGSFRMSSLQSVATTRL
jgi:hypothetical protein